MKKILLMLMGLLIMNEAKASAMKLKSPELNEGKIMNAEQVYTGCGGKNISPELSWGNAPKGTKSFAITVYDPDAPTGSGWWHWVVFNIPASETMIKKGASQNKDLLPKGAIESNTDFGKPGYGGACPPKGDEPHRYIFTIYALDIDKLSGNSNSTPASIGFEMRNHILVKDTITVLYGNK